jgi:exodeoxyribonuclease-5
MGTAALIIIDECSMVGDRMGADLLSFGVPILVLGDPAQLPPIGSGGFFTKGDPNTMLTEIHRQAGQSPIIEMATIVRNGGYLEQRDYTSEGHAASRVIDRKSLTPEIALGVDQIIVGRNATRRSINKRMRNLLGFNTPDPMAGDRIVCLRNNHDLGLLNGSLWNVEESEADDEICHMMITPAEGGPPIAVTSWMHAFQGREDNRHWGEKQSSEEFDFGYALTCHKAQGSQFENVLVMDESKDFRRIQNRWLYTALTRASNRVVVAA